MCGAQVCVNSVGHVLRSLQRALDVLAHLLAPLFATCAALLVYVNSVEHAVLLAKKN